MKLWFRQYINGKRIRRYGERYLSESDMLPPLKSLILKWGLLAQWLYWAKYLQAILACPAILLPGHGRVFYYPIVWIPTVYAVNILFASSRMLIAALRSLSISFPHSQWYTLSDNLSSFFILPHLQHFLLEGKTCFFHFDLFWKHCHLLHCIIYSKYLCSTVIWFSCLVFTAVSFIQQTCKIFSGYSFFNNLLLALL